MTLKKIALLPCLLIAFSVFAEETPDDKGWKGEGELGYVAARGNTETETISGKLKFSYTTVDWLHELGFASLKSSAQDSVTGLDEETADRFQSTWQSNWNIDKNSFLFVALRYEKDEFSGYDNQSSGTLGYGYTFYDTKALLLKTEFGAGTRHSEFATGEENDESIFRVRVNHGWQFMENSRWTNELLVESGEDNRFTEFVTGLKVDMSDRFALKVAYAIRENSDVPVGRENRDTLTTINLVYAF